MSSFRFLRKTTRKPSRIFLFLSVCRHASQRDSVATFHPFGNLMLAWYPVRLSSGEIFPGGELLYDMGNRQSSQP